MQKINVGILSIGSGVGQSVIESLRLSNFQFNTIGLGNNPLAFGAYECDEMILIPSFYDNTYIDALYKLCIDRNIQILIPGTDDEALILSKQIDLFKQINVKIIVSEPSFMMLIRDKNNLSKMFMNSDTFLPSYNLDEVKSLLTQGLIKFPLIAKPKNGNASNGINILLNANDLVLVSDNDVIQECAIPNKNDPNYTQYINQLNKHRNPQISEYSFQIVLNQYGDEISRMVSFNSLKNGIPIEIIPCFNEDVWFEINKIIPELKELGARGPINIQGRLTDNGLKCFEINARFTGMTGLRAELGFNEVEKLVLDYLNIENSCQLSVNTHKVGIRQTTNKSIYKTKVPKLPQLKSDDHPVKTVLITGANGFLGSHVIKHLDAQNYTIIALVRNEISKTKLQAIYTNMQIITLSDIHSGQFNFGEVDTIIHTLFARPHRPSIEIQESLEFTQWLLTRVTKFHVPEFINISSFSVYGQNLNSYPRLECDSIYSQAKYACELMVKATQELNPHLKCVNLRLTTLIGQNTKEKPIDFISKWVISTLNHQPIQLISNHVVNRLDVNDAAIGIIKLMENIQKSNQINYDLASVRSYSLLEILDLIKQVAKDRNISNPIINYHMDFNEFNLPIIDISDFYKLTNWLPSLSMVDSITELFDKFSK